MTTLDVLKELKDAIIDFNIYLKIISVGLKQLETGAKAIVDNIRTFGIDELSIGIDSIIAYMKKDLEQGRILKVETLKSISSVKSPSSTISTISTARPTKTQTHLLLEPQSLCSSTLSMGKKRERK